MTETRAVSAGRNRMILTDDGYAREKRHSRRIRFVRRSMPVLAMMLVAGLFVRSAVVTFGDVSVNLAGTTIEGGKLIMADPKMGGFTGANRPYELSAKRAIQDIRATETVELDRIDAKLPVGTADWADVDSASGLLHKVKGTLELTSPVAIKTSDGITARMSSGELTLATGDITGKDDIEVDTGRMRVTADNVEVTGGGKVMVFKDKVRMTIGPRSVDTAAAGGEAAAHAVE